MSAPRELLTAAAVAAELGVSRRRVSQLLERRPDFPRPYAVTRGIQRDSGQRLWRPEDIAAWAATADRSVGRPKVPTS
jgi:predicted DNA-binding transcriptional regulator AlpA